MVTDMPPDAPPSDVAATLPARARLSINRCNLPPVILGSLTFQAHPQAIEIDGVRTFHADLFARLGALDDARDRARQFQDYMAVKFRLNEPEDAGGEKGRSRTKADYLRVLRGWFFDSDAREGAVFKSWAESRFGLITQHHKGIIHDPDDPLLELFQRDRARGLHNTNALESQLDLVHAYCQWELARRFPEKTHVILYRGVNRLNAFEVLDKQDATHQVMLFNNVNSFTADRDMAGAFGDYILTVRIPFSKILFFSGLLPGHMQGEDEYIVLGGVYAVETATF